MPIHTRIDTPVQEYIYRLIQSYIDTKAVNREDKRSRRYRDRDFAKSERSRRYRDRYRC
jgi:hypothetical protein